LGLSDRQDGGEIVREPLDDGELIVWTAVEGATTYVAVFWTGRSARSVSIPVVSVVGHAAASGTWTTRDLWDAGTTPALHPTAWEPDGALVLDVPSHGVRWVALDHRPDPQSTAQSGRSRT
jgi:hypothetical protein